MRNFILQLFITHMIFFVSGCYSFREVKRESFSSLDPSKIYRLHAMNGDQYVLDATLAGPDASEEPIIRYSPEWNTDPEGITLVCYSPLSPVKVNSIRKDTIRISAESIISVHEKKLDDDASCCIISGAVVVVALGILIGIELSNFGTIGRFLGY